MTDKKSTPTPVENMLEGGFLSFLGAEENQLLSSIVNLNPDMGLFQELDRLYQLPLQNTSIEEDDLAQYVLAMLYLYTHSQMYFSVASYLRCHSKEAFSSTRSAIDAALSAYRVIEEPGSEENYLEGNKEFVFIKQTIKKALVKNSKSYPLAGSLIEFHEFCSKYGSHADLTSVVIGTQILESIEKKELLQHYFDRRPRKVDGQYFLIVILTAYLKILEIFLLFFRQRDTVVVDNAIVPPLGKLRAELQMRHEMYNQQFSKGKQKDVKE